MKNITNYINKEKIFEDIWDNGTINYEEVYRSNLAGDRHSGPFEDQIETSVLKLDIEGLKIYMTLKTYIHSNWEETKEYEIFTNYKKAYQWARKNEKIFKWNEKKFMYI